MLRGRNILDTDKNYFAFYPLYFAEWMNTHNGQLPTLEEICNIWNGDPEDAEYNEKLLWYADRYLEVVAGREYWNTNIRPYKLLTDTIDVNNKDGVAVPKATEAFGLLVYANCRDKWMNIWDFQQNNPGVDLPKEGTEAKQFLGKYTNNEAKKKGKENDTTKDGSGGEEDLSVVQGWSDEGLKLFDEYQQKLVEQREKDAENDHKMAKHARELIRKHHKISESSKKKRKRGKKSGDGTKSKRRITRLADE